MTNVDILMGLDANKLAEVPTRELKIARLSKLAGTDFIVKVKAIPAKRFTELVSGISDNNGNVDTAKAYDANVKITFTGLVDPSMKDKDLMVKFDCSTPAQLVEKLFQGGEIGVIADAITELSGFGKNTVEEVKN